MTKATAPLGVKCWFVTTAPGAGLRDGVVAEAGLLQQQSVQSPPVTACALWVGQGQHCQELKPDNTVWLHFTAHHHHSLQCQCDCFTESLSLPRWAESRARRQTPEDAGGEIRHLLSIYNMSPATLGISQQTGLFHLKPSTAPQRTNDPYLTHQAGREAKWFVH